MKMLVPYSSLVILYVFPLCSYIVHLYVVYYFFVRCCASFHVALSSILACFLMHSLIFICFPYIITVLRMDDSSLSRNVYFYLCDLNYKEIPNLTHLLHTSLEKWRLAARLLSYRFILWNGRIMGLSNTRINRQTI